MAQRAVGSLRRISRARSAGRNTETALASDIDGHGAARRSALRQRISAVLEAFGQPARRDADTAALLHDLATAITPVTPQRAWLVLAALEGALPDSDTVLATVRTAELDGSIAAIRHAVWSGPMPALLDKGPWHEVRIITGTVVVDVHHTAQTDFATGIQRVVREASRRWLSEHHPTLIGWHPGMRALRALTAAEVHRACWGGPPVQVPEADPVVIPWNCTYLLPELAADPNRARALLGLTAHSGNVSAMIGYDLVPATTAETSHDGIRQTFPAYLAFVRHARVVAAISRAAADEWSGWRAMLDAAGLPGPRIAAIPLAVDVPPSDDAEIAKAATRLLVGGLPMVLVVGSHEPRKNHVAVLHAAELLWREGHRFSLTFVGGNSWNSERFTAALQRLQMAGRPVESISAATDQLLFGGYRLARFTVFPSVNEGYGLPVAESLSCGTPVITSGFGSMREIAQTGGALLVDPRDDHDIAGAMRRLLTDDRLRGRLHQQAAARPVRTWDSYAEETWHVLTGGATQV